jgi:hypothetical protein
MSEQKVWEYKVEDIFEDIPGDPANVNMTIPEEIREAMGVEPGDPVRVLWGDKGTIKIEKITQEEYDQNNPK